MGVEGCEGTSYFTWSYRCQAPTVRVRVRVRVRGVEGCEGFFTTGEVRSSALPVALGGAAALLAFAVAGGGAVVGEVGGE